MEETTLFRAWTRRIATRGALVVLLMTVPVVVAGLISFGGGGGLLPEGIASLSSGPSTEAAGIDVSAADGRTPDTVGGLVALTVGQDSNGVSNGRQGNQPAEAGGPTGPAANGTQPSGGASQPGGAGGDNGGGSGGGTPIGPGGTPAVPGGGNASGPLSQTLDDVGKAVNQLIQPK